MTQCRGCISVAYSSNKPQMVRCLSCPVNETLSEILPLLEFKSAGEPATNHGNTCRIMQNNAEKNAACFSVLLITVLT